MCPTFIVLTDSHYVPATDTLTGIGCKSTNIFLIARKKRKEIASSLLYPLAELTLYDIPSEGVLSQLILAV